MQKGKMYGIFASVLWYFSPKHTISPPCFNATRITLLWSCLEQLHVILTCLSAFLMPNCNGWELLRGWLLEKEMPEGLAQKLGLPLEFAVRRCCWKRFLKDTSELVHATFSSQANYHLQPNSLGKFTAPFPSAVEADFESWRCLRPVGN